MRQFLLALLIFGGAYAIPPKTDPYNNQSYYNPTSTWIRTGPNFEISTHGFRGRVTTPDYHYKGQIEPSRMWFEYRFKVEEEN